MIYSLLCLSDAYAHCPVGIIFKSVLFHFHVFFENYKNIPISSLKLSVKGLEVLPHVAERVGVYSSSDDTRLYPAFKVNVINRPGACARVVDGVH